MIQTRNVDPRTIRSVEILLLEPIPILLFLFYFLNSDSRMITFHGNKKEKKIQMNSERC